MPTSLRQLLVAVRAIVALTVVFGVIWPLAMTGWAQVINRQGANGSIVTVAGHEAASSLLAQDFTGPTWFHARPSVAGDGYDAMSSGGSNLAPSSSELVAEVAKRHAAVAAEEGCAPSDVPPDAVSASGSGLDPDISTAYAALQAPRVARENGLTLDVVTALIDDATHGGVISSQVVNVVALNAAIAAKVSR